MLLLFCYACDKLGVRNELFVAQIGRTNTRSVTVALFASFAIFDRFEIWVVDVGISWSAGQVWEYA
jgi:hypothetical protein